MTKRISLFARLFILCFCFGFLIHLGDASAQQNNRLPSAAGRKIANKRPNKPTEQFVSIDFNDVDIRVFIKFISELTGRNFVIDNRVKGKVTIISPGKISMEEAYRVFESVLEVNGYSTVKAGKIYKIVPAPDARSKSIETRIREESGSPSDKVVTQLIRLKYADPNEIKRLFAPMISKSSAILAYPQTNMLIVTDVHSNIKRLMRILKAIDVTGIGREITVIPLKFADASEVVGILTTVFKAKTTAKKGTPDKPIQFVADERTNAIILLASEDYTLRVKKLIGILDQEIPREEGNIHVYYCEHATAEDLAKVLQELPSKETGTPKGQRKGPVVSEKVRIAADKATNSLIITADARDFQVLQNVIQKLDIPRGMVYIESLIMEVDVNKSLEFGVDWTALTSSVSVSGNDAVTGGGFGGSGASRPSDLANPDTNPLTNPSGFALGIISEPFDFGGIQVSNIRAIIRAIKTDDDFQILSTPQVLTTDNEEARITIVDNIPYQTTTATADSGDTYNSFEYRDVGKILKITPHITRGRMVRLKISLEVSQVIPTANPDLSRTPSSLKRTVDTTVIVNDNDTLVIGGLIEERLSNVENKVPCLGDIPSLKYIFGDKSEIGNKQNLYIFLTPRVIENPLEAEKVYTEKKEFLNQIQEDYFKGGQIRLYNKGLPPDDS